ncbi:MAG: efflux RND transporter periplasmic adaptor subunit [Acidobacteria bacterium]|nr:efflux RND transporter periplasmic adaptor subunit [Acidobacteriota bacterium]MBI3264085.1 efflux RND transporter periplasmic adaptor subunit [Acidobacteriota bacterium]
MPVRKSRKTLAISIAVLSIVTLGVAGYSTLARSAVSIDASRLATVERGDLARSVVATGRIEPISKVDIKSKANGIIEKLRVDVGDRVRTGQMLAELDKENLSARLREARAALMGAEANVRAAQAEHEKNKVEAEGPDVDLARRNLERADKLHADKLISQQNLEEARTQLSVAENRQHVASTQLGVTEARVGRAGAEVAQARAAFERAQEELDNATIKSPIDGIVLARPVEVGSPVSSILNMGANATLVMVLGDISQVYVKGEVDETDIGTVKLGQRARIRVETFKDRLFEGRVTQISPMGTKADNVVAFDVKVSIDNPTGELLANMTANAEIVLDEHKRALVIPEMAIFYDAGRKPWADVVDPRSDSGKRRVAITIGISNGTRTEVVSGLGEGQRVVLQ